MVKSLAAGGSLNSRKSPLPGFSAADPGPDMETISSARIISFIRSKKPRHDHWSDKTSSWKVQSLISEYPNISFLSSLFSSSTCLHRRRLRRQPRKNRQSISPATNETDKPFRVVSIGGMSLKRKEKLSDTASVKKTVRLRGAFLKIVRRRPVCRHIIALQII